MSGPCRLANAPCFGRDVMDTSAYASTGYARRFFAARLVATMTNDASVPVYLARRRRCTLGTGMGAARGVSAPEQSLRTSSSIRAPSTSSSCASGKANSSSRRAPDGPRPDASSSSSSSERSDGSTDEPSHPSPPSRSGASSPSSALRTPPPSGGMIARAVPLRRRRRASSSSSPPRIAPAAHRHAKRPANATSCVSLSAVTVGWSVSAST